jgi:hypothetical protein
MNQINPKEHARFAGFGHRKVMPRACVTDSKKAPSDLSFRGSRGSWFHHQRVRGASEMAGVLDRQEPDLFVLGVSFDGVEVGNILEILVKKISAARFSYRATDSIMVKAVRQIGEEYGIAMLPALQTPFSAGTLRASVAALLPQSRLRARR